MARAKHKPILLSDVVNILATGAHDGLNADSEHGPVVTVDEMKGHVTVTYASSRTVYQRFHIFVVEEP